MPFSSTASGQDHRVGVGDEPAVRHVGDEGQAEHDAEERADVVRDLRLRPEVGDHVERDDQQRAEERAGPTRCGAWAWDRRRSGGIGVRRAAGGTGRIVVVRGRIEGDIPPPATGRSPAHDPDPASAPTPGAARPGAGGPGRRPPSGARTASASRGRAPVPPTYQQIEAFGYQRFTNREQSRLDFGSRLLDLAEDDGAAPAGAGEVPRHLLRAARRVLPNPGRRPRGPGGRRRAHPLASTGCVPASS